MGAACPSVPYTTNKDGRGPAWSNSLFNKNGVKIIVDRIKYNWLLFLLKKSTICLIVILFILSLPTL